MFYLRLERFLMSDDEVVGRIVVNGYKFYTLENKRFIIPMGLYDGSLLPSSKFKRMMPFLHVPDRSGIIIHKGNVKEDSRGCILVGYKYVEDKNIFGKVSYRLAHSSDAFERLYTMFTEDFKINIVNNYVD